MKDQNFANTITSTFKDWSEEDLKIIIEGRELMGLHREIEMYAEIIGSRFGYSMKQIEILEILFTHPDKMLTPAELADKVYMTRSTMTGNLDTLEQNKLVSRESHPKDRRMTLIKLTEDGIKLCKEIMPQRYTEILGVMKNIPLSERDLMKKIYEKLLVMMRELATEATN